MTPGKNDAFYEVLSPWAEADPVPLKGPRPAAGQAGWQENRAPAEQQAGRAADSRRCRAAAKRKIPYEVQISRFEGRSFSVSSLEPERRAEFEDWLKGVDAVIAAVGD